MVGVALSRIGNAVDGAGQLAPRVPAHALAVSMICLYGVFAGRVYAAAVGPGETNREAFLNASDERAVKWIHEQIPSGAPFVVIDEQG
jgi:hypothetical protein